MKRKIIFFSLAMTVLLLGGCSRKYTPNAQPQSDAVQNNNSEATVISEEEATEIALTHAGLTADQVIFTKSGLDRDDLRVKYNIEFYTDDRTEYDYEIDGYSGTILDWDIDSALDNAW